MYNEDILVIVYPHLQSPQQVIIVDPFDSEVQVFLVSSQEEVYQVLQEHLPWCTQHHSEPVIHFGSVHIVEWSALQSQLQHQ
jgi:hypothetical protein